MKNYTIMDYQVEKGKQDFQPFLKPEERIVVNDGDLDSLFHLYEAVGLGAKGREYIAPYIADIKRSYQTLSGGAGDLLREVSLINRETGERATNTFCLHTHNGIYSQMVANYNPMETGKTNPLLTLKLNLFALNLIRGKAFQCGFKESTSYTNNLFGEKAVNKILKEVAPGICEFSRYEYMMVPKVVDEMKEESTRIDVVNEWNHQEMVEFMETQRSAVFVKSEGLHDPDEIELPSLNKRYQQVGAFRFRKVLLGRSLSNDAPIAAAVVYRGPLRNFRCLGNVTYLIVDPLADTSETTSVINGLIQTIAKIYQDFPLPWIPMLVNKTERSLLEAIGGEFDTQYCLFRGIIDDRIPDYWLKMFGTRLARLERKENRRKEAGKIPA